MKKPKAKYYIATIRETNGGLEYDTKYLFKTAKCPIEYNDLVARTWRGGSVNDVRDESVMGYWSDGNTIQAEEENEIPETDFKVLKKHLSVL